MKKKHTLYVLFIKWVIYDHVEHIYAAILYLHIFILNALQLFIL